MTNRRNYSREAWEDALEFVSTPDDLPTVKTGGMWTARKLYFLCTYLEQVVRGMAGNASFPTGLTYVDLFCGCGVSEARDSDGHVRRLPGSSVLAARAKHIGKNGLRKTFNRLVFVDADRESLNASQKRSRSAGFAQEIVAHCGDVNEIIDDVASSIPDGSLNVAFVDPYSLDIHFSTISRIARQRALDLIILFSDRIDLIRNVRPYYYPKPDSKLDHFLGESSGWRDRYDRLTDQSGEPVLRMFADLYLEQLRKIGYVHSRTWLLEADRVPMFRLVFASKNPLGLKYCEIALKEEFDGQRGLFG